MTVDPEQTAAVRLVHPTLDLEVEAPLGRGGMAVVYQAREVQLERRVAVKILHEKHVGTITEKRFAAEALIMGRLEHPAIVPVHSYGKDERGRPFLSMKIVLGRTWEEEIKADPDVARHLRILQRVCEAVAFANARGVIHRDLKPANVFIGAYGEVAVSDWGIALDIAKRQPEPASLEDSLVGTPAYMAPEMTGGETFVGPWTDVFLLGGILYRILTGFPPHQGSTITEVLRAAAGPAAPLETRAPGKEFPESLKKIVRRALDVEPAHRYQTARELAAAIDEHFQAQSSSEIAAAAMESLAATEARIARTPAPPPAEIYAELAGCGAQLEQACALWPENAVARSIMTRARLAWARYAIDNDDPTVAEAQLEQLAPETEGVAALRRAVADLRAARDAVRRRRGIITAMVLAAAIAVGAGAIAVKLARRAGQVEAANERRREALAIAAPASMASAAARVTIYGRAIAADPSWREGAAELSGAYMDLAYEQRLGDPAKGAAFLADAVRVLDPVLEANPDYAVGFYYRGYALEMLGEAKRAAEDYARAAKLAPATHDGHAAASVLAIAEGRWADAETHATAAIALAGDEDDLYRRGIARFALGKLEGALEDFDAGRDRSPAYAEYDAYAALVHLARGDTYTAAERLVEGARKQASSPLVLPMLAYLAARRGDNAAAAELAVRAKAAQAEHARCFLSLDTLHRPLTAAPAERGILARALVLDLPLRDVPPEGARSVEYCARGEDLLGAGEPGNAIAFARRALADDPSDGRARLLRGTCFARLGQKMAATADLDMVDLISPERTALAGKVRQEMQPK